MPSFDNVRLPEDIEVGAQGGPAFKTTVTDFSSGNEQRNQDWSEHRCKFDISYGISNMDDLKAVKAFFFARRGMARGFRFKDWSDYELEDEPCGTGDGVVTAFQMVKVYEPSGPHPYTRRITRPVASTITVKLNGVLQGSGYSLNAATGVLTFSPAVPNGVVVTVSGEFDVPCRFDTDRFDVNMEAFEAGTVPGISICEVRE